MHGTCANNNPSRVEHLSKVRCPGSHSWLGSRKRRDSRMRHLPGSVMEHMQIPALRAARELCSISADIPIDSDLHLKTQTSNRED